MPTRGRTHTPAELAAFQDGERRLVYARYKNAPDKPLYKLPKFTPVEDREALRHWVTAELECQMEVCRNRTLSVNFREKAIDGFSHRPGAGGHSGESEDHEQAKHRIADWVRDTQPDVTVEVERQTAQPTNRPDVLLTWPDGRQVGVEVQYSVLSADAWLTRHRRYQEQGIVDVWVLGHRGGNFKPKATPTKTNEAAAALTYNAMVQTMLTHGQWPVWFNPFNGKVGTTWTTRNRLIDGLQQHIVDRPRDGDVEGLFGVDTLQSSTMTPDGLLTPRRQDIEDAEVRRERAALQRLHDGELHARNWPTSPLLAALNDRYGRLPDEIALSVTKENLILAPGEQWRSVLYANLIQNRTGTNFTVADCFKILRRARIHFVDGYKTGSPIVAFLHRLERAGLLAVRTSSASAAGYAPIAGIDVLHDFATLAAARDDAAAALAAAAAAAQQTSLAPQAVATETTPSFEDAHGADAQTTPRQAADPDVPSGEVENGEVAGQAQVATVSGSRRRPRSAKWLSRLLTAPLGPHRRRRR